MTHTPEPWIVGPGTRLGGPRIDANGKEAKLAIADLYETDIYTDNRGGTGEANAARLVACVNGCAGLNPAAYRACVEALHRVSNEAATTPEVSALVMKALALAEHGVSQPK